MNLLKRSRAFFVMIFSFFVLSVGLGLYGDAVMASEDVKYTVRVEEADRQLHYFMDDQTFPRESFFLYSMNNEEIMRWPHYRPNTPGFVDVKVPPYIEGYLKPDMFQSEADYKMCVEQLKRILFAGYPHNGAGLYKIVDDSSKYVPSDEEFNIMLVPDSILIQSFPTLSHHIFKVSDYKQENRESVKHMNALQDFVQHVARLYPNGVTSDGSLSYTDITEMPFYRAALSMCAVGHESTPNESFVQWYPGAYYITELQAYNSTQLAVSCLMSDYNLPHVEKTDLTNSQFSQVLYTYAKKGILLESEPQANQIELIGDLTFHYNPKDGLWHSGLLEIKEPTNYKGRYALDLPNGVTAMCDGLTYVYANEPYELVSAHEPTKGETFGLKTTLSWLVAHKQFSPIPEDKNNFMSMAGAVVRQKNVELTNLAFKSYGAGSLTISNEVLGGDHKDSFTFNLYFPNNPINGKYGPVEFQDGYATFQLKNGESITIDNLPANAAYELREWDLGEYQIDVTNETGTIQGKQNIAVKFVNTPLPDFTIINQVKNDDNKNIFTMVFELKDSSGNPINDSFYMLRLSVDDKQDETFQDILVVKNGKAEIRMTANEQWTIRNLPLNSSYKVYEKEANQNGYYTIYEGKNEGKLERDIRLKVINEMLLPANWEVNARVLLDGKPSENNLTQVVLRDEAGEELQRKTNSVDVVIFDTLSFDRVGKYQYTLQQIAQPDTTISYDKSVYTANVKVSAVNGAYQVVVEWMKDGNEYQGQPVFNNLIKQSSGGGGVIATKYTLHYEPNGGTAIEDERHTANKMVALDKIPSREDYQFTGWYADKDLTKKISEIKMTSDKTVYAGWKQRGDYIPDDLNSADHVMYVMGYVDGTVKPNADISRAETATMLHRLLTDERRAEIDTTDNPFVDIKGNEWYAKPVYSMANGDYIAGYEDGTFGGNRSITRAEFVAMLVRFIGSEEAECTFTDVPKSHWAHDDIATATVAGWVEGYEDGSFGPDRNISRAEAVSIINRVLDRGVNADSTLLDFKKWPDNPKNAWYYYEIIEATNAHEYTGSRPSENWTSLEIG